MSRSFNIDQLRMTTRFGYQPPEFQIVMRSKKSVQEEEELEWESFRPISNKNIEPSFMLQSYRVGGGSGGMGEYSSECRWEGGGYDKLLGGKMSRFFSSKFSKYPGYRK